MRGAEWKRRIAAIFFPERCAYCGQVMPPCRPACDCCLPRLPRIREPVCRMCGREKDSCTCGGHRRHYERCVAPFYYEGIARTAVLRFKEGAVRAALPLAEEMAVVVKREYPRVAFDRIVPVPMTTKAQKRRGFNQSDLLARELAGLLGVPREEMLDKVMETAPQKGLSALERSGNLLGAFDLHSGAHPEGKTLLLVDDIATTGATLDECAKMLKIYGADEIYTVVATASRLSKAED